MESRISPANVSDSWSAYACARPCRLPNVLYSVCRERPAALATSDMVTADQSCDSSNSWMDLNTLLRREDRFPRPPGRERSLFDLRGAMGTIVADRTRHVVRG